MGVCANPESVLFGYFTPWRTGAKRHSMDLDRKSTTEHLVAYITTHHESLVALLPPDTTCADLFGEVENSRHW